MHSDSIYIKPALSYIVGLYIGKSIRYKIYLILGRDYMVMWIPVFIYQVTFFNTFE